MPRNVRNFWIELDVDGSKKQIASGPVSKDGGFSLTIRQRQDGDIITGARITGRAIPNSTGGFSLRLDVTMPGQIDGMSLETKR